MSKKIEYACGEVVGDYGVIYLQELEPYRGKTSSNNKRRARFKCPFCGSEFDCVIESVKRNLTKSCGCQRKVASGHVLDLTGQRFGRLVALTPFSEPRKNKRPLRKWICKCECGNIISVPTDRLTSGHTKSCGCLVNDTSRTVHTKDITGIRSGLLVARYRLDKQDERGNYYWHCSCDCGRFIEVRTTDILTHRISSCGCEISRGETLVKDILNKENISFETQYVFTDCINPQTGARLKFDFYLPDYNCCIEYDGTQHFQECQWTKSEGLEKIQTRDKIKNIFCSSNNIRLIRIPYTDYGILDSNYIISRLHRKGED